MSERTNYTLDSARAAAERDDLAAWVDDFLASPGSDNAALGEQLRERRLKWFGPVEVPLERLNRLAGPAEDPVLCPVDEDYWGDNVDDMERKIDKGWDPPPVIVAYDDGQLMLEDGNHRVEGLRRSGAPTAWALIGFETSEQRDGFMARGGLDG